MIMLSRKKLMKKLSANQKEEQSPEKNLQELTINKMMSLLTAFSAVNGSHHALLTRLGHFKKQTLL